MKHSLTNLKAKLTGAGRYDGAQDPNSDDLEVSLFRQIPPRPDFLEDLMN
jgi:hypothetical protein